MCMKPVLTINIPEIENGAFDLFTDGYQENGQLFGNADHFFVKQTEIAKLLGYAAGNIKIQFEGAVKCPDTSTRPFVFIAIPLVIDFLDALPTTGNRRKNSRIIEGYIAKINTIFRNSYNPINDIKGEFYATDPAGKQAETSDSEEIEELKKRIKALEYINSKFEERLTNACFALKRIERSVNCASEEITAFFKENKTEVDNNESC